MLKLLILFALKSSALKLKRVDLHKIKRISAIVRFSFLKIFL